MQCNTGIFFEGGVGGAYNTVSFCYALKSFLVPLVPSIAIYFRFYLYKAMIVMIFLLRCQCRFPRLSVCRRCLLDSKTNTSHIMPLKTNTFHIMPLKTNTSHIMPLKTDASCMLLSKLILLISTPNQYLVHSYAHAS